MFSLDFTGIVVGVREVIPSEGAPEYNIAVLADGHHTGAEGIAMLFLSAPRVVLPEEVASDMVGKRYTFHCRDIGVMAAYSGGVIEYETLFFVKVITR